MLKKKEGYKSFTIQSVNISRHFIKFSTLFLWKCRAILSRFSSYCLWVWHRAFFCIFIWIPRVISWLPLQLWGSRVSSVLRLSWVSYSTYLRESPIDDSSIPVSTSLVSDRGFSLRRDVSDSSYFIRPVSSITKPGFFYFLYSDSLNSWSRASGVRPVYRLGSLKSV